ncbi:MAG: ribosome small subunit-dependent GTPase A [Myxococcales bacterium]|nr:ribosome small subunit-dependent GTPase A [Myxococcales bacterium]
MSPTAELLRWGYRREVQDSFAPFSEKGMCLARVVCIDSVGLHGVGSGGSVLVHPNRRYAPAIGDWIVYDPGKARLHVVLPRWGVLARRRPGRTSASQNLAVNVDVALIMTGLDDDFSVPRIERYLALTATAGVRAVLLLNKVDLIGPDDPQIASVRDLAGDRLVIPLSVRSGLGLEEVRREVPPGHTAVLLGSSGVGKSSLTNALVGEARMATGDLADGRGQHTTTHRELIPIPGGGLIADVPGLREVGLVGEADDVEDVFEEVGEVARACRFSDCGHGEEPGCAVREALASGLLLRERYDRYLALRQEAADHAIRATEQSRRAHEKNLHGQYRKAQQAKRKKTHGPGS